MGRYRCEAPAISREGFIELCPMPPTYQRSFTGKGHQQGQAISKSLSERVHFLDEFETAGKLSTKRY
jgi:hypothetical protein